MHKLMALGRRREMLGGGGYSGVAPVLAGLRAVRTDTFGGIETTSPSNTPKAESIASTNRRSMSSQPAIIRLCVTVSIGTPTHSVRETAIM
jgi:hypothetical protein